MASGQEQVREGEVRIAKIVQPVKLDYKKTYKTISKLEVFFTGGRIGLSKDGSFAVCPCGEEAKVVDIASGAVRATLPGDSETVTAIAVSPDGVSVFTSSRSLQTKWWCIAFTPVECKRSWKAHDGPVVDMAVDSSGGLLATGSADRTIRVWDIERGYCTHSFRGHEGIVSKVLFHPDTHRLQLFSGGDDATVRVWDLVTKACVATFSKHFSRVTGLSLSADGWLLLSASRDKVVNVWDLRDNTLQHTVPVFEALEAVSVVEEGSGLPGIGTLSTVSAGRKKSKRGGNKPLYFLTAGESGALKIWKADSATCVYEQKREERNGVGLPSIGNAAEELEKSSSAADSFTDAMVMPDGKTVLAVTGDHRLAFYKPKENDCCASLKDGDGDGEEVKEGLVMAKQLIGYNDEITDLKFIGKDQDRLAVSTNSEQIRIYDTLTSTCEKSLVGHSDIVLCLDAGMSTTGRPIVVSAGKDHNVRLWDVDTGACVAIAVGHMEAVSAVALSRKRRDFILSGGSDRTLKVWSLEGVMEQWRNGYDPVRLKSKALVAAHDKDINTVAISPNDAVACSGSQDRTARLWNLPNLTASLTLRGHKKGVWSAEFSPIDRVVVTGSGDKTIRIWSLETGTCVKAFEGHTASVLRVSFLTRGTQLISAGADGLIKLWTIRSNECVNTFDQHDDKVWALAVSSKEVLATGGSDSVVNVWEDCTQADDEAATREAEEDILKDQDLSNALASADYGHAIGLGFELKRPQKLLHAFGEILRSGKVQEILDQVVSKFDKLRIRQCLQYVREWNTNSRHCHLAQRVLQSVLSTHPMKELVEIPGMRELIDGLVPYSTRHFSRLTRLVRSTYLLDYTLLSMSVLFPQSSNGLMDAKTVISSSPQMMKDITAVRYLTTTTTTGHESTTPDIQECPAREETVSNHASDSNKPTTKSRRALLNGVRHYSEEDKEGVAEVLMKNSDHEAVADGGMEAEVDMEADVEKRTEEETAKAAKDVRDKKVKKKKGGRKQEKATTPKKMEEGKTAALEEEKEEDVDKMGKVRTLLDDLDLELKAASKRKVKIMDSQGGKMQAKKKRKVTA